MGSHARMQAVRFGLVVAAIGVIAAIDFRLHANPTTVALTFLVAVLLVFAFLITALVASNLAERARRDAEAAKQRRREVELLYDLSQRLLASENELELLNALPVYVQETFSVRSVSMMAADHPSIYRSSPDAAVDENLLRVTLLRGEPTVQAGTAYVPLRLGVRIVGALAVTGYNLSRETLDAIGSLAGLSIERVRALEALSKHQAMQESERLRSALLDSVTHEFRTPLTAIKANVTTLLSGGAPGDQGRR